MACRKLRKEKGNKQFIILTSSKGMDGTHSEVLGVRVAEAIREGKEREMSPSQYHSRFMFVG